MLSKIEHKLSELFEFNPQPAKNLMQRLDNRGITLLHVWKILGFVIQLLIKNENEALDNDDSSKEEVDLTPLLKRIDVLEDLLSTPNKVEEKPVVKQTKKKK